MAKKSKNELARIAERALDRRYGYGVSTSEKGFGWRASVASVEEVMALVDRGVTDIERLSDAAHRGWARTARLFANDPNAFPESEELRKRGELEKKIAQRKKLAAQSYASLSNDEKEKDRVLARAVLDALTER
jgi:hypothetical protein